MDFIEIYRGKEMAIDAGTFIFLLEHFTYFGMFVFLALTGYIIPLPEEIFLLLAGYLAAIGFASLPVIILVCLAGVLFGDNIVFFLSRFGFKFIFNIERRIKGSIIERYTKIMKKHPGKAIFSMRFIPGLRFFAPVLAGSLRVKWKTFEFFDFLAAIIFVPILILIGYFFHEKISYLLGKAIVVKHIIFIVLLIIIGAIIMRYVIKHFLKIHDRIFEVSED